MEIIWCCMLVSVVSCCCFLYTIKYFFLHTIFITEGAPTLTELVFYSSLHIYSINDLFSSFLIIRGPSHLLRIMGFLSCLSASKFCLICCILFVLLCSLVLRFVWYGNLIKWLIGLLCAVKSSLEKPHCFKENVKNT